MQNRFEFLEHTADAYIAAYGNSLEEAFENAALATMQVMTDLTTIEPRIKDQINVRAPDEYALLYNWLEEFIIRFDTDGNVYSRIKILKIEETSTGLQLSGQAWGERFDPNKHSQKVGIKAITYHQMIILRKENSVIVKFLLDI